MIAPATKRKRMRLAGALVRMGLDSEKVLRAVDYPAARALAINENASGVEFRLGYRSPRSRERSARTMQGFGQSAVVYFQIGKAPQIAQPLPLALNDMQGNILTPMAEIAASNRAIAGSDEPSGTDLDTRTAIVNSGTAEDGQDVGWSRLTETPYLVWGGDNTDPIGSETVTVDLAAIRDGLGLSSVDIRCRAFWYAEVGSGLVNLSVAGGQDSSENFTVTTQQSSDIDGEDLTVLTFDTTGGGELVIRYAWDDESIGAVPEETYRTAVLPAPGWPAPDWVATPRRTANIETKEPPSL